MNLFVSKLSPRINAHILEVLFRKHGEVAQAKIIYDRITGDSRCFGFVEMPNEQEALNAIEALNDFELDGKAMVVVEAEPPKKKFGPIF
jgi:RNA recognition motif-containing protein